VLDDWRTAPIDRKLHATLALLEKLTLTPGKIGNEDIEALRAEGVRDEAIEDVIHVAVAFNIIDRIADSLGFEIPTSSGFANMAEVLLKRGY
jgi:alkylhydroperoxidase family enzyme